MEQKSQLRFEVEAADPSPTHISYDQPTIEKVLKVRLDKWLWAARCYKTLALARAAIEQGFVLYDGQAAIPSKEIAVGVTIELTQGKMRRVIIIRRLLTRRRTVDDADPLFEEVNSSQQPHESMYEKNLRRPMRYLRRTSNQ